MSSCQAAYQEASRWYPCPFNPFLFLLHSLLHPPLVPSPLASPLASPFLSSPTSPSPVFHFCLSLGQCVCVLIKVLCQLYNLFLRTRFCVPPFRWCCTHVLSPLLFLRPFSFLPPSHFLPTSLLLTSSFAFSSLPSSSPSSHKF